jgi:hypothetical protein
MTQNFFVSTPLFLEDEDIFKIGSHGFDFYAILPITTRADFLVASLKKCFFIFRGDSLSDRLVPVNYLYWIFLYCLASYSNHTKLAIFQIPITLSKI